MTNAPNGAFFGDDNKPPLCKGFASMRSMLAGVAETGSGGPRTLINSLPCVRGGGPRSGGRVVTILQSACADSSLYTREP